MRTRTLISLCCLLLLSGCVSGNVERNAYVTIGSVGASANAAIGAYHSYTRSHEISEADLRQARELVSGYLAAMETARAAVTAFKTGDADRDDVSKALDGLAAAAAELTRFFDNAYPKSP